MKRGSLVSNRVFLLFTVSLKKRRRTSHYGAILGAFSVLSSLFYSSSADFEQLAAGKERERKEEME